MIDLKTYRDHGIKKKKVMKMSKFVDKIDELLDKYNEKQDADVLESMIVLIDEEINTL